MTSPYRENNRMPHTALQMTEILFLICDSFDNPNLKQAGHRSARAALFALAQTNKQISQVALETLWRRLDTLDPLICLLDARCMACSTTRPKQQEATHKPQDGCLFSPVNSNLIRLRLYASYVRVLSHWIDPPEEGLLYNLCSSPAIPSPLLPNLQHCNWDISLGGEIDLCSQLSLGPSLLTFAVRLSHTNHDVERYHTGLPPRFNTLWQISPKLHTLKLPYLHEPIATQFRQALLSADMLTSLHIKTPLAEKTFLALSNLPNLEFLSISVGEHIGELNLPSYRVGRFGALRRLALSANMMLIPNILEAVAGPYSGVTSLWLGAWGCSRGIVASAMSAVVACAPILETFSLTIFQWGSRELDAGCIRPILALHSLRSCALEGPFNVSDEVCLEMGASWSQLTQLQVCGWHYSNPVPTVTLKAAYELTTICPQLENLWLHIDLAIFPDSHVNKIQSSQSSSAPAGLSLRSLAFSPQSKLGDVTETFSLMRKLWPNLRELNCNLQPLEQNLMHEQAIREKCTRLSDMLRESHSESANRNAQPNPCPCGGDLAICPFHWSTVSSQFSRTSSDRMMSILGEMA